MTDCIAIKRESGAQVIVNCFGATITSWKLPSGKEILYLSELCDKSGKSPIRGGIPIVFPQFNNEGPMIKHGFARISRWSLERVETNSIETICTMSLSSTDVSKSYWKYDFKLEYVITLSDEILSTELKIHNLDVESFSCQCLLHTYYSIPSIVSTQVYGMEGVKGIESVTTGKRREFTEKQDSISFARETDTKYVNTKSFVSIYAGDRKIQVQISTRDNTIEEAPDCVVWNAWVDKCHAIADMEDEDYKRYVCVEPGHVRDFKTVEPGHTFSLKQSMEVEEFDLVMARIKGYGNYPTECKEWLAKMINRYRKELGIKSETTIASARLYNIHINTYRKVFLAFNQKFKDQNRSEAQLCNLMNRIMKAARNSYCAKMKGKLDADAPGFDMLIPTLFYPSKVDESGNATSLKKKAVKEGRKTRSLSITKSKRKDAKLLVSKGVKGKKDKNPGKGVSMSEIAERKDGNVNMERNNLQKSEMESVDESGRSSRKREGIDSSPSLESKQVRIDANASKACVEKVSTAICNVCDHASAFLLGMMRHFHMDEEELLRHVRESRKSAEFSPEQLNGLKDTSDSDGIVADLDMLKDFVRWK